jgi:hypothetical protein
VVLQIADLDRLPRDHPPAPGAASAGPSGTTEGEAHNANDECKEQEYEHVGEVFHSAI